MKPTIFIGSSSEGFHIAQQVEKALSSIGECKVWKGQFDLGSSTYEDLVQKLSLYDYGILIATCDDKTESRGKSQSTPRDNVVFEFGLFVGRLGRQRAFLMAESGLKLPSDLNGITLPFFPSAKPKGGTDSKKKAQTRQKAGIAEACGKIMEYIKGRARIYDFGFLPSTALAYGYFTNFVVKVVSQLLDARKFTVSDSKGGAAKEMEFEDLELVIWLPNDLRADMFDQIKAQRQLKGWSLVKVAAGGFRPFDFYIQMDKCNGKAVYLSDIPITLNALNEAIHAYIGKSYIDVSEAERLLESRELRTFQGALQSLIEANPLTKNRAKIELVPI